MSERLTTKDIVPSTEPSPAFSMRGWSNSTWLKRQAPAIKQLITYVVAAVSAWVQIIAFPQWAVPLIPVISTVISIGARYLMDRLDYYVTENPGMNSNVNY